MEEPQYETLDSAAAYANVTRRTIQRWIAQGHITGYRIGVQGIRVNRAELAEFIRPVAISRIS